MLSPKVKDGLLNEASSSSQKQFSDLMEPPRPSALPFQVAAHHRHLAETRNRSAARGRGGSPVPRIWGLVLPAMPRYRDSFFCGLVLLGILWGGEGADVATDSFAEFQAILRLNPGTRMRFKSASLKQSLREFCVVCRDSCVAARSLLVKSSSRLLGKPFQPLVCSRVFTPFPPKKEKKEQPSTSKGP